MEAIDTFFLWVMSPIIEHSKTLSQTEKEALFMRLVVGGFLVTTIGIPLWLYVGTLLSKTFKKLTRKFTEKTISPLIHAGQRRKVTKAAGALKKSVESFKSELEVYNEALKKLINAETHNNAQLAKILDNFKLSTGALTLSPLGSGLID